MILTESEAIRGVVIVGNGKGNDMRGIHNREIIGETNPEAASRALVVIGFEDETAKGGAANRVDRGFRDERWLALQTEELLSLCLQYSQ